MAKNPRIKIKRDQLWRLLTGGKVYVPSSVALLEVEGVPEDPWQPLVQIKPTPPHIIEAHRAAGLTRPLEVWGNETYEVMVVRTPEFTHLSIKRYDRAPARDWRHFQQMKNEICGPEAEGVELYPAESRIADNANQYHLWVSNEPIAIGFPTGMLTSDDQVKAYNDAPHSGRQEPWQEGLTTGEGRHDPANQVPGDGSASDFIPPKNVLR